MTVAVAMPARTGQEYGTIVIVGGGCYGSQYVRQLGRASLAGVMTWKRMLVVDHDPDCRVARSADLDPKWFESAAPELRCDHWTSFFADYLSRWATAPDSNPSDAIVPSPLMPHLMYQWLRDRAVERWPGRSVSTAPLDSPVPTPWQRASPDGTHYASFAEWICPVNCIEPDTCPHTRGARTWTMPRAIEDYAHSRRAAGQDLTGPFVFHCTHRAYGVGMLDTSAVIAADAAVRERGDRGAADVLVGTVSHCHGALNLLSIR